MVIVNSYGFFLIKYIC